MKGGRLAFSFRFEIYDATGAFTPTIMQTRDVRRVYTTEKFGSGPANKVVQTHNVCKEILETPVFLYKSYGSVLLFWRVRNQIFL